MLSVCADERKIRSLRDSLLQVLDEAIQADQAAFGTLQVLNRQANGLQIFVQRGFSREFLSLFELVRSDDPSVCGRAFRYGKRIVVRDITEDPLFASYLSVAQKAGFCAVQSTPILNSKSALIGVLSTYFAKPHTLSHAAKQKIDSCVQRAAQLIEALSES